MNPPPPAPDRLPAPKKMLDAPLIPPPEGLDRGAGCADTGAARTFSRRSRDLFQGSFRRILRGIDAARAAGIYVDLFIISPRYGVISEDAIIMPYSMSLTGRSKRFARELARKLGTRERVQELLRSPYDICMVTANKSDLLLVHDPAEGLDLSKLCKRLVVISAPSVRNVLEGAEFIGIENVGARAERLVQLLDAMTSKTLNDY